MGAFYEVTIPGVCRTQSIYPKIATADVWCGGKNVLADILGVVTPDKRPDIHYAMAQRKSMNVRVPQVNDSGAERDVDVALTTREFVRMRFVRTGKYRNWKKIPLMNHWDWEQGRCNLWCNRWRYGAGSAVHNTL